MRKFHLSKLYFMIFFLNTFLSFGQSKKEQIFSLTHLSDSLSSLLDTERKMSSEQKEQLNKKIDALNTTNDVLSKRVDSLRVSLDKASINILDKNAEIITLKENSKGLEGKIKDKQDSIQILLSNKSQSSNKIDNADIPNNKLILIENMDIPILDMQNNYLNEIIKYLIEDINQLNQLTEKEKTVCFNKIYAELKNDRRIKEQLPYFGLEGVNSKYIDTNTKQIDYAFSFGTQASLTSKFFFIKDGKEVASYNFEYLKAYPNESKSFFDINNKDNKVFNLMLLEKVKVLIGMEYYNYIMNSSFQDMKSESNFFIEEDTKIYDSWEKAVLIIIDTKNGNPYIVVKNGDKVFKFSQSNLYPAPVLDIMDRWIKGNLFKSN